MELGRRFDVAARKKIWREEYDAGSENGSDSRVTSALLVEPSSLTTLVSTLSSKTTVILSSRTVGISSASHSTLTRLAKGITADSTCTAGPKSTLSTLAKRVVP